MYSHFLLEHERDSSPFDQSKLLSKAAQNPYAQYSSTCTRCKTKVSQGHTYCHKCAYKADCEFISDFHST